ncbi:SDR family NAD(P)-dependent oxidoreductase, partial [Kibdelosporangium lantanae]
VTLTSHRAHAGAAVVVNDIDGDLAERTAENIRSQGGRVVASSHTVADPAEAQAIVNLCVREFGKVDGLVNNAGLNYEAFPWDEDIDQVRELVEVNVLGVMYTGIAAARQMRAQGGGSIVNVSSGAHLGQRKLGIYAASKGAVASLTYSWALDMEEVTAVVVQLELATTFRDRDPAKADQSVTDAYSSRLPSPRLRRLVILNPRFTHEQFHVLLNG